MNKLLQFLLLFILIICFKNIANAQDHWLHLPSPYYVKSISQADSTHLVVAGGNDQKIFKSDDGGDSFKEIYGVSYPASEITDVSQPFPEIILAIIDSVRGIKISENPDKYQTHYASYIVRSEDSGKTWSEITFSQTGSANARIFRQIIMSDKDNGIISQQWADTNRTDTLSPILYTQDGGLTWKNSYFPNNHFVVKREYRYQSIDIIKYISTPKPGVWFIAGYNFKDNVNEVWATFDYGQSWRKGSYPMSKLRKIQFINDSVGYAIGGGSSVIAKTVNGGLTWANQPYSDIPYIWNFQDMDFIDENNGLIADYRIILRTENGGKNWTEENIGLSDSAGLQGDVLKLISYFDRNHAIGVARMKNILRYVPEGIAEQPQITTPRIIAPYAVSMFDVLNIPGSVWWKPVPGAVKYYIEFTSNFSDSTENNYYFLPDFSQDFGEVRVRAKSENSLSNWSIPVTFYVKRSTSVQDNFYKNNEQPFPNPSSGITYIPFKTTNESQISITISDALGKSINTFKSSYSQSQNAIILSDVEQLPNGIYFVHISQGKQQQTSMITISK